MSYLTTDMPDLEIVRHLAELSKLAYVESEAVIAEMLKGHYSEIGFLNDPRGIDSQVGFVAANADTIVVVFRGTRQVMAWLDNFRCDLVKSGGRGIHRDFVETVEAIAPQLDSAIEQLHLPGREIWLTGHSRGGALATVAADRLQSKGYSPHVFTFGAPQVGDEQFAESYSPESHLRFENFKDPVPFIPRGKGYQPVGKRAFLPPSGAPYIADGSFLDFVVFGAEKVGLLLELPRILDDPVLLTQAIGEHHHIEQYLQKLDPRRF